MKHNVDLTPLLVDRLAISEENCFVFFGGLNAPKNYATATRGRIKRLLECDRLR